MKGAEHLYIAEPHHRSLRRHASSTSNLKSKMAGLLLLLLIVATLQVANAFSSSRSPLRNMKISLNMVQKEAFQLVLLRHGESSWNKENKFTGWYDCPLSEKGHAEAAAAGALLKEEGKLLTRSQKVQLHRRM